MAKKKRVNYLQRSIRWWRENFMSVLFYTAVTLAFISMVGVAFLQMRVERSIGLLEEMKSKYTVYRPQPRTEWRTIGDLQTLLDDLNEQLLECQSGTAAIVAQSARISSRLEELDSAMRDFNSKMQIIGEGKPE